MTRTKLGNIEMSHMWKLHSDGTKHLPVSIDNYYVKWYLFPGKIIYIYIYIYIRMYFIYNYI